MTDNITAPEETSDQKLKIATFTKKITKEQINDLHGNQEHTVQYLAENDDIIYRLRDLDLALGLISSDLYTNWKDFEKELGLKRNDSADENNLVIPAFKVKHEDGQYYCQHFSNGVPSLFYGAHDYCLSPNNEILNAGGLDNKRLQPLPYAQFKRQYEFHYNKESALKHAQENYPVTEISASALPTARKETPAVE